MIKVHKVFEGPYAINMYEYMIEVYLEDDDGFQEASIISESFNHLYEIVKHMKSPTIEPYIIEKGIKIE